MAEKTITFKMMLTDLVTPVAEKINASVSNTVNSVASSINAANSTVATLTTTIADTGKPLQDVAKQAQAAATAVETKLEPALEGAKQAAEEMPAPIKETGKHIEDAEKKTKSFGKKVDETKQKFEGMAKIASLVIVAVKGIEAGIQGTRLVSALLTGDFEKQARAAQGLEDAIKGIPGVGALIVDIGANVNNWVTGEKDATDEIKRQTALLEKQIQRQEARTKESTEATNAMKTFTEQIIAAGDASFATQEQVSARQIANLKKALKEVENLPGFAGQAKKNVEQFRKDVDAIINRIVERTSLDHAIELRKAQGELVEAQLRDVHRVAEADREAFKASLDEKQRSAAKLGADFAKIQEKVNNVLLATFDREANEKRRDFIESIDNDLSTRLLRATGSANDARTAATLDQQFQQLKQRRDFDRTLNEQGVPAGQQGVLRDRLAEVQAMEQAQLRLNQAVEHAGELESQFGDKIDLVHAQIDAGQISIVEGSGRIRDAQGHYNTEVEKSIALLEEMKAKATDPEQVTAIEQQIDRIRTAAIRAKQSVSTFGSETINILDNAFQPAFSSIIQGTGTVKDAIISMLKGIGQGFADLASKLVANLLFKKILTSVLGGSDFFTTPTGLASGGLVPGRGTGDVVPAMLTPGEYVIPAGVVAAKGVPFFEDLRASLFGGHISTPRVPASGPARFATGGLVSSSQGSSSVPTLVADEATLERLLAGGGNALIAALGKKKDAARRVLGVD